MSRDAGLVMTSSRPPRGRIIVTGMAFFVPLPGVIYQILHYLIGLRQLGYDACYIEDSARWVYDSTARAVVPDAAGNVAIVSSVLDAYGFGGKWAFRNDHDTGRCYGMRDEDIRCLYRECDALLNVTGQSLNDHQLDCPRRLYIETDPFASQVRFARGDGDERSRLLAHDTWFTFGENIGAADCGIPPIGIDWLTTRQPVVLELWQPPEGTPAGVSYTTITTWENQVEGIIYDGDEYFWQKGREFEKFFDLPRHSSESFQLALSVDDATLQALTDAGWTCAPADEVANDTATYRAYIWQSRGEFTVARDQYVRPRTGWFSDRSACYLAAGKPVITQETAFSKVLPTGRGLFAFRTVEEIVAAVEQIEADHAGHSSAAREIAAEYFAAEKVVASLMERASL